MRTPGSILLMACALVLAPVVACGGEKSPSGGKPTSPSPASDAVAPAVDAAAQPSARDAAVAQARRDAQAAKPAATALRNPAAPLPASAIAVLKSIRGERLRPRTPHYFASNEYRYDLWFKFIKDVGGAYVGVGPDQNYSIAAAANVKLMLLMDFDAIVLRVHKFYKALVRVSPDPKTVLDLLRKENKGKVVALLSKQFPAAEVRRLMFVHTQGEFMRKRHAERHRQPMDKGGRTWLSDPVLYRRFRQLVLSNRVWTFPGDLTKGKTMAEVAAALVKIGLPLRVIYFSNAEEYWPYPKGFRDALTAMPVDDKGYALRTVVLGKKFKIGFKFHYTVQKLVDFVAWLKLAGPRTGLRIHTMVRQRIPVEGRYFSRLPGPPAGWPAKNKGPMKAPMTGMPGAMAPGMAGR